MRDSLLVSVGIRPGWISFDRMGACGEAKTYTGKPEC